MKNLLILFFVVMLMSIVTTPALAQHPLGESQLLIGNGYFKPAEKQGDGTWRYAEARIIPGQSESNIRLGLYLSAIEVGSRIDGFYHHSTELGGGLAMNFNFQPGWKYEKYGWANIAWKKAHSKGSIREPDGMFENSQSDQMLHLGGGIIFQNTFEQTFLIRQKVMFEYQTSLKSDYEGSWNNKNVPGEAWDKERFKVSLENALFKTTLSWQNEIHLLPAILLAYSHEKALKQDFLALGAVLTLVKGEYNQEILTLSYQSKFELPGDGRMDILEININVLNFFKKNNY
jgi:hypothetical protein